MTVSDDPISRMRERVAQCRRLADQITDQEAIAVLRQMADEGEIDIKRLSAGTLDQDGEEQARRTERIGLSAEVRLRRPGEHGYWVSVFDLSPEGCKIEFVNRPSIGATVWVKFEDLEAIQSTVRWIDGHVGGLEFQHRLHSAVFKRLAKKSPTASGHP